MRCLADITVEQAFGPGEWLFRHGDRGDSMYIVARGAVEVMEERGDVSTRIATLGGGDVLGEMSLLSGEPRNAGARALTSVTVGRISRADFELVMTERPALHTAVWRAYGQHRLANALRLDPAFSRWSALTRRDRAQRATLRALEVDQGCVCTHEALVLVGAVETTDGSVHAAGAWVASGAGLKALTPARLMELPA
jgi:CRP-like cAMP-binding protein